jgi:type IV pilus assembly protein PilB
MRSFMASSAAFMGQLGQRLLAAGQITQEQLDAALERKKLTGEFIGEALVAIGATTSKVVGQALAEVLNVPYVDLLETAIDPDALARVSEKYQRRHRLLPFKIEDGRLYVAMADPLNVMVVDDLRLMTGLKIVPMIALTGDILDAYNRSYTVRRQAENLLSEMQKDEPTEQELSVDQLVDLAEDAPIIRLVNSVILGGINANASDIHIEPQERNVRVRYRMDGVLYEQMHLPSQHHPAVVSRLKIMARLNIAERRRPQDGRVVFNADGVDFDLRLSTMPTIYGEKVVLRVLDKAGISVPLEALGFFPEQRAIYEGFIRRPHGMILVTGPTGSGKSTTLYASLNKINDVSRNIITVEDPVEYNLEGISQMQANPKIGLTFATGLRTIVRQDPDVIMVGEIRDTETAEIAVQAALTGHLVFSTLHTNDAPGAVIRLQNMGIEGFLITSSLLGVIGQRLMRKVCTHCAQPETPDEAMLRSLGIDPALARNGNFRRGRGCPKCSGRGYRGRTAAYEVMRMTDRMREAVLRNQGGSALKEIAIADGMMTMREAGVRKALEGETTLDEVCRVLLTDERGDNDEALPAAA